MAAALDVPRRALPTQSATELAHAAQAAWRTAWPAVSAEEATAAAVIRAVWHMYSCAWAEKVTACTTHPEHYEEDLPVLQSMASATRVASAVDACADAALACAEAAATAACDLQVLAGLARDAGATTVDPLETGPLGPFWGTATPHWFDRLNYEPVDETQIHEPLDFRSDSEPIAARPGGTRRTWWKLW